MNASAPISGVRGTDTVLEGNPCDRPLPCVVIVPGTEESLHELAMRHLSRAEGWYRRSGSIVQAGTDDEGHPTIIPVSPARFVSRLSGLIRWQKYNKKGEAVETGCPSGVAASAFTAGDWPALPVLVGVQDTPIMRPDGTLWQTPGYDPITRTIYAPTCTIPPIPDHPTDMEANESMAILHDIMCDFVFERPEMAFLVWSAVFSVLARTAIIGPVIAHLFTAPQPGTGKGLQAQMISEIALGHPPVPFHFPLITGDEKRESDREEEQEKRLAQAAMSGTRILNLDNLKNGAWFGGPIFDRVSAAPDKVALRKLGENHTMLEYHWRAVFVCNGNHIHVLNDSRRRCGEAKLVVTCANPSQRALTSFRYPLADGYCLKIRGILLYHCFVVLLHHAQNGFAKTHDRPDLANFNRYQSVVCDAIVRAGGLDPSLCILTSEDTLSGEDMIVGLAMRVLEKLEAYAGGRNQEGVTASNVADLVWPKEWQDAVKDNRPTIGEHNAIIEAREAFTTAWKFSASKKPGAKAVGSRLGDLCGRVLSGGQVWPADDPSGFQLKEWRIAQHIDRKNQPRYTLVPPRAA